MQYEYKTIEWHLESGLPLGPILNEAGSKGWVFQTSIARQLVFMRPVPAMCAKGPAMDINWNDEHRKISTQRALAMKSGRLVVTAQQLPPKIQKTIDEACEACARTEASIMSTPGPLSRADAKPWAGLKFDMNYPASSIKDDEGRTPNKRVCTTLELLAVKNVGQLLELMDNQKRLDDLPNCGHGTKARIRILAERASKKLGGGHEN